MPIDITINNISGSSPYNIYLCDNPVKVCVYINTITSTPYEFTVPQLMSNNSEFNLKIVDNNGCSVYQYLSI
jgi:hypothetical protein